MKKIQIISLILVFALLLGGTAAAAVTPESSAVTKGCRTVDARVPLGGSEKLVESADAVFLYELNTGTLVYGWNVDGRIDPTGMVKLLTVMVALENCDLDEEVTVKRSTLNSVAIGSVSANLQAGEVIAVRDLLYCVMVASANDAAAVLAEHIAGSQTAFVEMMNEKAASLGCTDSYFANVHGLSGTGQYSTARDLARIVVAALEDPVFVQMFCAEQYQVAATNKSEPRDLITTNYMMSQTYTGKYYDARLTGGKTAAASLTDRSLICTAEVGTSRYLCILMSAEATVSEDGFVVEYYGSFEETKAVLDYGFGGFAVRQVVDQRQTFAQYAVTGGENDVVVHASEDVYAVLPVGFSPEDLQFSPIVDADALQAPVTTQTVLGTLEIRYQNIVLGNCDLQAMYDVALDGSVIYDAALLEKPTAQKFDYVGLLVKIGLVLIGILLVAALVLVSIRLIRSARIRRQHRRRMRNRRRSR